MSVAQSAEPPSNVFAQTSATASSTTFIVSTLSTGEFTESATRTVKLKEPSVVGLPEISPVSAFKFSPGGRFPEMIDQVYGGRPPDTSRNWWYAILVFASGRYDDTMRGETPMIIDPFGEEKTSHSVSLAGVHVPVNMPSLIARSGVMPSSCKVIIWPSEGVTVTGPAGLSQLILKAESVVGTPTTIERGILRTEKTGLFVQLNEP